jgi:hypothetical protein
MADIPPDLARITMATLAPAIHGVFDSYEADIEKLKEKLERVRKTLGEISRMRLMPDDKVNRITLHAAIEIARMELEIKD